MSRKQGVVDLQTKLGLGTMVAEMFEDEKLNKTATKVEEMYAELRRFPTGRILAVDPRIKDGSVSVTVDEGHKGDR